MTISVVILNFSRPSYIKNDIIPALNKIDLIDEIIISHGKKEVYFESNNKKVKNLIHYGEMNKKYGLTLRFISAVEAKNNYIIIMDDDIIPAEHTIERFYESIKEDEDRIYGIYGRAIDDDNQYIKNNVFGYVPIILTRCLITTKLSCQYFLDNFRNLENDNIKASKPYWNGEDIVFNLLNIKRTGKLNKAIDLKHHNRLANYLNLNEAISSGAAHDIYRKKLTSDIVDKLNIDEIIKDNTNIRKERNEIIYFFFNSNLFIFFLIILIPLSIYLFIKYFRNFKNL